MALFRALFAPPRDLILLLAAGWLGLALADRWSRHSSVPEKALDALVFWILGAFVLGGRLLFYAAHLSALAASPASVLALNASAFDTLGGVVTACIVGIIVIQRLRIPAWETLDLLTPLLATLAVGIALSHIASGAAFGAEAQLPWSIQLWGAERHPTQAYELIAGLVTLGVVWLRGRRREPGVAFLTWLALAAASRLIVEGFRGDSTLVLGGIRLAQLVAWLVLAGALIGLELVRKKNAAPADAMPVPLAAGSPQPKRKRTAVKKSGA